MSATRSEAIVEVESRNYTLTPSEYLATCEKIAKANDKATRKGFTGRIEFTGEPKEIERHNSLGIPVKETVYNCTLTGIPAHYAGFTFLATVVWDQFAGLIVRAAPGAPKINRDELIENGCSHCGVNRYRKETYILSDENGNQLQVGSTCLKDFLPTGISPVFLDFNSIGADDDGFGSFGSSGEHAYSVETVLGVAWAVIKVFGWTPASSYDGTPTKYVVPDVFDPPKPDRYNGEYLAKLATVSALADDMLAKGAEVRAFILSDEFKGDSDYVLNLKAIMHAEYVSASNLGIIVSAPQAWAKYMERSLIQKAQKENAKPSNWIAGVGDKKVTATGTLTLIREIESMYGVSHLYKFIAENGDQFSWFSSRAIDELENNEGKSFILTGTVKAHKEFRGVRETVFTRCTIKPV